MSTRIIVSIQDWLSSLYGTNKLMERCVVSGALFSEELKGSSAELAFKYAVMRINKDRSLLPNVTFQYDIQYVPKGNSFRAAKMGMYNYLDTTYNYDRQMSIGRNITDTPW